MADTTKAAQARAAMLSARARALYAAGDVRAAVLAQDAAKGAYYAARRAALKAEEHRAQVAKGAAEGAASAAAVRAILAAAHRRAAEGSVAEWNEYVGLSVALDPTGKIGAGITREDYEAGLAETVEVTRG